MTSSPLRGLRRELAHALVALDYDGTLAPIVADPTEAVPAEGAREVLFALARRVGRLAIVTGRPAHVVVDLGGFADLPSLVVLGQYGAERWEAGQLQLRAAAPGIEPARRALADLPDGAVLEDKGTALVVHTRRAAEPSRLLAALRPRLERIAADTSLECHPGRFVLELRPPGDDKGTALRTLLEPLPSAVLYAGDDVGDLPAFAALDGLGLPVLRLCSDSAEAPEELRRRADLVVDGPSGVVQVLRSLLEG